jgi:hypothetical protein
MTSTTIDENTTATCRDCPGCDGSSANTERCPQCNGAGVVSRHDEEVPCGFCEGEGTHLRPCELCACWVSQHPRCRAPDVFEGTPDLGPFMSRCGELDGVAAVDAAMLQLKDQLVVEPLEGSLHRANIEHHLRRKGLL